MKLPDTEGNRKSCICDKGDCPNIQPERANRYAFLRYRRKSEEIRDALSVRVMYAPSGQCLTSAMPTTV